jgi:hopanoid biosynthesis associated protein HpnK
MIGAPASADAVRRAHRMPKLRIGLHLAVVQNGAISAPHQIPDLVDRAGALRSDLVRLGTELVLRPSMRHQLASEITAQFEAYRATGLELDHVNAHMHFHLHPIVGACVIAIGQRYGMHALRVPREPIRVLAQIESAASHVTCPPIALWSTLLGMQVRRAGLRTASAVFGVRWSGAMTATRLRGLLGRLPAGLVEIYGHPATADTFHGYAAGYRYRDELAALTDPACKAAVCRSGFQLGGYGDFPG